MAIEKFEHTLSRNSEKNEKTRNILDEKAKKRLDTKKMRYSNELKFVETQKKASLDDLKKAYEERLVEKKAYYEDIYSNTKKPKETTDFAVMSSPRSFTDIFLATIKLPPFKTKEKR